MAVRLRIVDGKLVALCAAENGPMPGDRYLDDSEDHALRQKYLADYHSEGLIAELPGKETEQAHKCMKCGGDCQLREKQYFWRGRYFPGWVCPKCNILHRNPDFFQAAKEIQ